MVALLVKHERAYIGIDGRERIEGRRHVVRWRDLGDSLTETPACSRFYGCPVCTLPAMWDGSKIERAWAAELQGG